MGREQQQWSCFHPPIELIDVHHRHCRFNGAMGKKLERNMAVRFQIKEYKERRLSMVRDLSIILRVLFLRKIFLSKGILPFPLTLFSLKHRISPFLSLSLSRSLGTIPYFEEINRDQVWIKNKFIWYWRDSFITVSKYYLSRNDQQWENTRSNTKELRIILSREKDSSLFLFCIFIDML